MAIDVDTSPVTTDASGPSKVPVVSPGSVWGFTTDEVSAAQAEDPDIQLVRDWLILAKCPSQSDLTRESPAAKSYWLNRQRLVVIDGVIYISHKESKDKLLLLPKVYRDQAMEWNHCLPSAGHQGRERTRERLKEKYYWFGMSQDIANFVAGCSVCNSSKKSTLPGKCPLTEFHSGFALERVHIDFLGPLPRTPRGNEHILMVVDQFTKWVECIPLPSQSAKDTAQGLVDGFISRMGVPFEICSDQGRNFESKLFSELCKLLHIHKSRTTPYRPSANGQVERYNRTLMDAVRCFIGKSQNQWDLHLQQIAGALRSAVNRHTGFSPNKMVFLHENNTPAQVMFPHPGHRFESADEYVRELGKQMLRAHEIARRYLKAATRRMKRNYDLRILKRNYEVGDAVYLLDTAVLKGKCKKLCPPWKGPGVVVEKLSDYLFKIRMRNSTMVVNHDRLKPCKDRTLPAWIKRIKEGGEEVDEGEDNRVYCFCRHCRQPWQDRFMIACDWCDEWYHGSCVDITPSEATHIDKYRCPPCSGLRS
jgi:hypothetical protein